MTLRLELADPDGATITTRLTNSGGEVVTIPASLCQHVGWQSLLTLVVEDRFSSRLSAVDLRYVHPHHPLLLSPNQTVEASLNIGHGLCDLDLDLLEALRECLGRDTIRVRVELSGSPQPLVSNELVLDAPPVAAAFREAMGE